MAAARWLGSLVAGVSCLALQAVAAAEPAAAQEPGIAEVVHDYAARHGRPGSPAHTAALREALEREADALEQPQRRGVRKAAPRTPRPPLVLTIDKDPRYQQWLASAARRPLISEEQVDGGPRLKVRSVGSVRVPDASHYPDVALVFERGEGGGGRTFCSGVTIDRRTVLTAGHCLCGSKVISVAFGPSLDGSIDRIAVAGQARHEGIRCRPNGSAEWRSLRGRDIAVLRLAREVPAEVVPKIRAYANPALIVQQFRRGNRTLEVLGFGENDFGAQSIKNMARIPILSPDCSGSPDGRRSDAEVYGCHPGREILGKDWRRVGPCFGDSGGGAYISIRRSQDPGDPPERLLAGLVSRTILGSAFDCGDGEIFTLLTPDLREWVVSTRSRLERQAAVQ